MPDYVELFDRDLWRPALEKYGAVTQLTVTLYDGGRRRICGPLPATPLFALFQRYEYEPGIQAECAQQCLDQREQRHAVIVSHPSGIAVVGASLLLDGEVVGAAVAGYALADFCQSSAIASLARQAGVPFGRLWSVATRLQPVPSRRLAMHGDLLQVLGDTILRENERTRQFQDMAATLECRVDDRTLELASANKALELELKQRVEAEAHIRRLLARLVAVQEQERYRIARDVHDHLGQLMTALKLKLEFLGTRDTQDTQWDEQLIEAQALLGQLQRDIVAFARDLRPLMLDDFGIARTLASFVDDWSHHYGIDARFQDFGVERIRLAADVEVNLFRIAQEALNNIHKHARSNRVDVRLQVREPHIVLTVEDDGAGFDPANHTGDHSTRGMGLIGMRERAALMRGTVDIESATGRGTAVIVVVPIHGNEPSP